MKCLFYFPCILPHYEAICYSMPGFLDCKTQHLEDGPLDLLNSLA